MTLTLTHEVLRLGFRDPAGCLRHASHRFAVEMGNGTPWQALADVTVQGYEIHHGQTALHPAMLAKGAKFLVAA